MTAASSAKSGFLLKGFKNPSFDSTSVFRTVLNAFSHPGKIYSITATSTVMSPGICDKPTGISKSASAFLLALADVETNLWMSPPLNTREAGDFFAFHTGCKVVALVQEAQFALVSANQPTETLAALSIGSDAYPDRSATLIVCVSDMFHDRQASLSGPHTDQVSLSGPHIDQVSLSGPGIELKQNLFVQGISSAFWWWLQSVNQNFPRGIDVIFASDSKICVIPRSTKVEF